LHNKEDSEKEEYFQTIWRSNTIPNVKNFIWRIGLNNIATKDNLKHRRVVVDCKLCAVCKQKDEKYPTSLSKL